MSLQLDQKRGLREKGIVIGSFWRVLAYVSSELLDSGECEQFEYSKTQTILLDKQQHRFCSKLESGGIIGSLGHSLIISQRHLNKLDESSPQTIIKPSNNVANLKSRVVLDALPIRTGDDIRLAQEDIVEVDGDS